ncbi:hypothetical protein [Risungbinella massiliensis]|uniref:hypothetical protein n=1 Tax=Risungbinella massiliensis TaxID=1329796 RepID=UPI0011C7B6BF|nr:hypothetical protein [Risungbinella massiliensis]
MSSFQVDDIWYGKTGTPYENVTAIIHAITTRNVQVVFDQVVSVDGLQLGGRVFTQKEFQRLFDHGQQLSLFDDN